MVPVALVRPVWWVACRSVRFVTALVLMALLLGGGAARAGLPGATGATEFRSDAAAVAATSSDVDDQASATDRAAVADGAPTDAAGDLTAGSGDPTVLDGRAATATGESPATESADTTAVVAVAVALLQQPVASEVRPGTGAEPRPARDAYARATGPRAPPLG
ncbi:hypothetical protein [Plantactinospora soyae]|uniref:Uncharacterized protein n=1 Tax=Plantactinospora soyae TaxID=1544732 RepID=A0A927M2X9_9ACTN|nr:hypothetical protein [Plantactinospora soyae]MBE1484583.1 hypothetical protein [Plantactinospora soyae]